MKIDINRPLFYKVCCDAAVRDHERFNIGTYKEKKLHSILKHYFEPDPLYHEIPFCGYIADIKREDQIIEIETSGFSELGGKLSAYLPEAKVNLVYPIPHIKYVSWIDPDTGDISQKRRSPKKKGVYDALFEAVRIAEHINHPNLTITAVLLNVDDYRMLNGWSRDRKKGSTRYERIPTDICDIEEFKTNADYAACLPEFKNGCFTAAEFAKAAGISGRIVSGVLKVLRTKGIIEECGKRGRAKNYTVSGTEQSSAKEVEPGEG